MFIESIVIKTPTRIIREIRFKMGLNLIVDNTLQSEITTTGNSVGKTTILKLVDFCLGAKPDIIYKDTEHGKEVYDLVKDFLIDSEVSILLTLSKNLSDSDAEAIVIERNFLPKKNAIRKINGEDILDKDFENKLLNMLFPHQKAEKPSFRQIISHSIRYRDESINKTLKTLHAYTSDVEYETLNLFLLGCIFSEGEKREALLKKLKNERQFKKKLENKQTKTSYIFALSALGNEIEILNKKKSTLNLNENFEEDIDKLNNVKYQINKYSSSLSKMKMKRELINASKKELEENASTIDLELLEVLYQEVNVNIQGLQKTFADLVSFHNKMITEKIKFITEDLPLLEEKIRNDEFAINTLLKNEAELSERIAKSDSFEELEKIIADLSEKYKSKGEYEAMISQIIEAENNIKELTVEIDMLDSELFSQNFEENVKKQLHKFNLFFSKISQELYDETYALKYDIIEKNGNPLYKFSAFNLNMSTGKKQGEILCFDLAYILFADDEEMSCLHFLLNDKKELLHHNQLTGVSEFIKDKNIQLIASIQKDKTPPAALANAYIAIELSQNDKLFKIEEN